MPQPTAGAAAHYLALLRGYSGACVLLGEVPPRSHYEEHNCSAQTLFMLGKKCLWVGDGGGTCMSDCRHKLAESRGREEKD